MPTVEQEPNSRAVPSALIFSAFAGYLLLNVAGIVSGQPQWSVAALLLVLGVLLWPLLRRGRVAAWLLWLAVTALFTWAIWRGQASAWLDAVPIAANAALAWVFARTLRSGHEPLITRMVRLLEGRQRLDLAGVRVYTRKLTGAWALMLGLQALLLAFFWWQWNAVMVGGTVDSATVTSWARAYTRFGCYVVIAVFFLVEYAFRRWHLRHLPHASLRSMMARVVQVWPQLLRGH